MTTFNLTLDENRRTATLTIVEHPLAIIPMDADSLSNLIALFSQIRSHMEPEIPMEWMNTDPVAACMDPSWMLVQETMHGGSLLHLRDPGRGWMHFFFPPERAEQMARYLTIQAESAKAQIEAQDPANAN